MGLNLTLPVEPDINTWLTGKPVDELIEQLLPLNSLLFETATIKPIVEQWIRNEIVKISTIDEKQSTKVKLLIEDWYSKLAEKGATDPMPNLHRSNKIESNFVCLEWARSQWFNKIESIYLQNNQSDIFQCSIIRVKSKNLALEIYHRIKAGELSFTSASAQFGHGPEVKNVVGLVLYPFRAFHTAWRKSSLKCPLAIFRCPHVWVRFALVTLESRNDCPLDSNTESRIYQTS